MIIGICGLIGSGKGSVADYLVDKEHFVKISFADTLKDITSLLFSWDRELVEGSTSESREWREHPDVAFSEKLGFEVTPRNMLQYIGTDLFRTHFHEDIWPIVLQQKMQKNPQYDYVVPDVRFPNEMKVIRDSGYLWQIKRGAPPSWWSDAIKTNTGEINFMGKYATHSSEWSWVHPNSHFDAIIDNHKDLKHLYQVIDKEIITCLNTES